MLYYLWPAVGMLIGFLVLFFVVDHFLLNDKKRESKKTTKEPAKNPEPKEPEPETKPVEPAPKSVTIYNSNLADELDVALKQPATTDQSRSSIAEYIAKKNYHAFNFDDAGVTDTEAGEDFTITKDDYKKMVALSNITDKK